MEKDQINTLVKNVDTKLFEIVHNLICSICQELFNKPVTTPCGHTFCSGCIKRVLSSKDNSGCPLCKAPVKRYGLEADEVKLSLSKICQELPSAFEEDVKDLTKIFTNLNEDLIRTSKLAHLYNQDYSRKLKTSKRKTVKASVKERCESAHPGNDSETFIPILKRSKNVNKYGSAKKKKLDDLVSISQTEPASNSSFCDSFELDKKLEKIEKVPPEEKVSEWFKAVGDNIYINSPNSILESDSKSRSEEDKMDGEKTIMIRRDYIKSEVCSNSNIKANVSETVDPYEFIPSQNNKIFKRKRQRRSTGKRIPDFKALQSFSKESIKRNALNLDESKEDIVEEETKDGPIENQISASQKFNELLLESKQKEKKAHVLYTASQSSSSLQFLDVSFNSKIENTARKKKTPRGKKKQLNENVLFKNIEQYTFCKEERFIRRSKRKIPDKLENVEEKKLLPEVMNKTPRLGEPAGTLLVKEQNPCNNSSTKLEALLKELLDDDIIYATRPTNAPVRLPELNVKFSCEDAPNFQAGSYTQNTQLIGFCSQEETPDEKHFKQMVENMEKELNSSECLIEDPNHKLDFQTTVPDPVNEEYGKIALINKDESSSCSTCEKPSKTPITRSVEFLYLGKLTPVRKRTKSTVVKLVFPIGLTSLARRRAFESRRASEAQFYKKQTCRKSTGIQTSQQFFSSLVQTSQVPQCSVNVQTSQEVMPSVEIQTTQKLTTTAEIQTSQRLVCQEIQTSQVAGESAQVQTSQPQFILNSNPKLPQTPIRKPSYQHRKIIHKKNDEEALPDSSLHSFTFKEPPVCEKDIIMDFGTEKEFEETWRITQKHEHLVELKNKKNKEKNEKLTDFPPKLSDVESDDSDVQPTKRRRFYKTFSQESKEIVEDFETRQLVPLDVRRVSQDEEMEVIDLDTPGSDKSEEQMLRVLQNINLDLPKGKTGTAPRGEKSEESDSDFFIEQTPPRPASRALDDFKNLSKSRFEGSPGTKEVEIEKKDFSEGADLISDSIPKGFSESFQVLSEKNFKDETQKKTLKIDSTVNLPDENDQNQLNSFEGKAKLTQLKSAAVPWKRSETSSPVKKLCVVASSVKNPDMIKKFASKFKIEYLNKPTKDMTHLIVGLHENEDKEMLPLCTPKLLFAMANKKWVVSELWAETCLKMNVVLPEDTFETLDPVGGFGCRKARLSCEKLLKNFEIFLLGEFQMISKEEFAELITDCGGTLVSSPDKFSFLPSKLRIIVADRECLNVSEKQLQELYQKYSTVILSRDVIIMSIQSYNLVNLTPYLLHQASEECLVKLGYPPHLVRNEEEDEDEEDINQSVVR